MHDTHIASLRTLLDRKSDAKTKAWWEGYVKDGASFMGVRMADIRSVTHRWHREQVAYELDGDEQLELALELLNRAYSEEKLAGILVLQEILLPIGTLECEENVDRFAELFVPSGIYDWNISDWFCVKVLGPLIERDGMPCAIRISGWRDAEDLWQARASLVAFVRVADDGAYYPLIEMGCSVLIRREERFAKTTVGWILRDISKQDVPLVRKVIEENIEFFSNESLRNATKYLGKEEQTAYLQSWKDA